MNIVKTRDHNTYEPIELDLDALEECKPDEAVTLDVWVKRPDKYIMRKRYRTFQEVYEQLHKHLNVRVCSKCGHETPDRRREWDRDCKKCGAPANEREALIDEYDSCQEFNNPDKPIAERDEEIAHIICFCEPGGNEGYSIYCDVLFVKNYQTRYVSLYRIKSFAGMTKAHAIVKRIMKLTGVWPQWERE